MFLDLVVISQISWSELSYDAGYRVYCNQIWLALGWQPTAHPASSYPWGWAEVTLGESGVTLTSWEYYLAMSWLMQKKHSSIADTLELHLFCTFTHSLHMWSLCTLARICEYYREVLWCNQVIVVDSLFLPWCVDHKEAMWHQLLITISVKCYFIGSLNYNHPVWKNVV